MMINLVTLCSSLNQGGIPKGFDNTYISLATSLLLKQIDTIYILF